MSEIEEGGDRMSEKQKRLETEKNDIQKMGLNLDTILQYASDIEPRPHQESYPGGRDIKDFLEFLIENVFLKDSKNLKEFIEEVERAIIIKTLAKFNGNQRETAEFLGIKYTTLNEKVKRYNIYFRKEPIINFYSANLSES